MPYMEDVCSTSGTAGLAMSSVEEVQFLSPVSESDGGVGQFEMGGSSR